MQPRIIYRAASKALGPAHWEVLDAEYVRNARRGYLNSEGIPVGIVAIVPVGAFEATIHDTWEQTARSIRISDLPEYIDGLMDHRLGGLVVSQPAQTTFGQVRMVA